MTRIPSRVPIVLALFLALSPQVVGAQFRERGARDASQGWAPPAFGLRIGFDNAQTQPVVGALVTIPILPSGALQLLPNADVTFFDGREEYQLNFEVVYVMGSRQAGLYFGGGTGFRNSAFSPDADAPSRNEGTFSLVAGARLGNIGPIRPELESRWIFVEELIRDPRVVSLGVSVLLW